MGMDYQVERLLKKQGFTADLDRAFWAFLVVAMLTDVTWLFWFSASVVIVIMVVRFVIWRMEKDNG